MDLQKSLAFLSDLGRNNNREWFQENKPVYQSAKEEFETFINILIPRIKDLDPQVDVFQAKECVFRIFRDVRFSKDKAPYKANFGAFIAKGGRKSPFAGYYVHVEPSASFVGGGIYMPQGPTLKSIRSAIYSNPREFKKIINQAKFKTTFGEIYGEKLKTTSRDFPKDWPDIDLLRHKHYAVVQPVDDSFWTGGDIMERLLEIFKVQMPLNHFLNGAVAPGR